MTILPDTPPHTPTPPERFDAALRLARCPNMRFAAVLVRADGPPKGLVGCLRCKGWACPACRPIRVNEWLSNFNARVGTLDRAWLWRGPSSALDAARQRAKRAWRGRGGCEHASVHADGGLAVLASDRPFPGAEEVTGAEALAALAAALRGAAKRRQPVSTSPGWKLPERAGRYRLAALGPARNRHAAEAALREAGLVLGPERDLGDGPFRAARPPEGMPDGDVAGAYARAARALGRRGPGPANGSPVGGEEAPIREIRSRGATAPAGEAPRSQEDEGVGGPGVGRHAA